MPEKATTSELPRPIYDHLVRLGLRPGRDFGYVKPSDSQMIVRDKGVRKLVDKHYLIKTRGLHVSLLPDDTGVVNTALVSAAEGYKRPGFWYIVLDVTGRPVAEYPLTYSKQVIEPHEPGSIIQPPSGWQAVKPTDATVETTGDLARLLVSWFVGYDRVNDDESAKLLEILSIHAESPREITLVLNESRLAQRLHDELLCFEDDVKEIPGATVQSTALREELTRLLKTYPV
jgi:hypothetical protein